MPTDLPVLVLIAVAATAVAVAVLRRTAQQEAGGGRPGAQAHRPGILAAAADMVDASIGIYMIRRALGRPTTTRAEGRAERARVALAAAEDDARRASLDGPPLVPPTRLVVAGTAAEHAPRELRDRQAHPLTVAPQVPMWRRRRAAMPSQGVLAAAGLVALFIVAFSAAFAFWPRPAGDVLSATGTPEPSPTADVATTPIPTDSPTTSAPAAEPTAALTPTPSPTATPAPGATATPTAAPTRTPRPTARPTSTPRPTASPTPSPTATVGPTPTPTPEPTATPTPEPTATPTPEPTATPTPEPTATPTPDPTPEPTPDPTP